MKALYENALFRAIDRMKWLENENQRLRADLLKLGERYAAVVDALHQGALQGRFRLAVCPICFKMEEPKA